MEGCAPLKPHHMAETSTSDCSTPENCETSEDICRDFLRNVCARGSRCRYRHPVTTRRRRTTKKSEAESRRRPVCHDYQNGGCQRRDGCRYEHVTRKQERSRRQGKDDSDLDSEPVPKSRRCADSSEECRCLLLPSDEKPKDTRFCDEFALPLVTGSHSVFPVCGSGSPIRPSEGLSAISSC